MTWFRRRTDRPPLHEVGEHPDDRFSLANERTYLATSAVVRHALPTSNRPLDAAVTTVLCLTGLGGLLI